MSTIFGVFDDPLAARRAVEQLRSSTLNIDDVSIVSRASGEPSAADEDVTAGEGAAVGAVWGGLVGLAALLIPGIGPFVALGALGAALTGAVTGAVVGGITAALVDFSGIPEAEARGYEDLVREGKTLIAVKAPAESAAEIRSVLNAAGADSIRGEDAGTVGTITGSGAPVAVAMYDEHGRRVDQETTVGNELPGSSTSTATRGATTTTAGASTTSGTAPHGTQDLPSSSTGGAYTTTGTNTTDRGLLDTPAPSSTVDPTTAGDYMGRNTTSPTTGGEPPIDSRRGQAENWTSGEVVGEGQGSGPRKDTGEYDAEQWVGEGQGDRTVPPKNPPVDRTDLDETNRR
jgi:uncharacterized membrane protein